MNTCNVTKFKTPMKENLQNIKYMTIKHALVYVLSHHPRVLGSDNLIFNLYSRTFLVRPPHWPQNCGLSRQVVFGDRFSYVENIGPSAKNVWSFKTGGLSWQWSLKTGFTLYTY